MCAVRRVYMDVHSANTSYVKKKVFLWLLSLHAAKKVTRSPEASETPSLICKSWIPACAGMTSFGAKSLVSGSRRNDAGHAVTPKSPTAHSDKS
jgi:hypothetical protein